MTEQVFGTVYADAYDAFYAEKDYKAECDLLEQSFKRFGNGDIKRVIDIGCGTGGHAIPLSQRGYAVTGVDRSSEMLKRARAKGGAHGPTFVEGDARTFDLRETFDAAVMMFAVLGYQIENSEVLDALRAVARHLRPGGLFAFDVWYGPAVLRDPPGERARIFRDEEREMIRVVRGNLDIARHMAKVQYDLWTIEPAGNVQKASEHHSMRFFFPLELELLLQTSGLRLVSLTTFGSLEHTVSDKHWNAFAVAVKT